MILGKVKPWNSLVYSAIQDEEAIIGRGRVWPGLGQQPLAGSCEQGNKESDP
jgi:hypothetical protein